MKVLFKIPYVNEMETEGVGHYLDYFARESVKNREIKKFNLDRAIDILDDAVPDLISPNLLHNKMNELQDELEQHYSKVESRMITNLLKKTISENCADLFHLINEGSGFYNVLITNLKHWEYIIEDSIYDLCCVKFIEYFEYSNSLTYAAQFVFPEYDEELNEIDSYEHTNIMTDQIQDYWNYNKPDNDFTKSCKAELILTFNDNQEIFYIFIPFENLISKKDFENFLLDNAVITEERKLDLCKISVHIVLTDEQIKIIGNDYDVFSSWYLECSGKFYFNNYE
jgi:hypothetical protein